MYKIYYNDGSLFYNKQEYPIIIQYQHTKN
jgi:hypothetical protein